MTAAVGVTGAVATTRTADCGIAQRVDGATARSHHAARSTVDADDVSPPFEG